MHFLFLTITITGLGLVINLLSTRRRGRKVYRKGVLARVPYHFHTMEVKSRKSKGYWRIKVFGKPIRKEKDIFGHEINIREWYAPNDWMKALVSLAYEDSKRRGMGRFSQAVSENMTNEYLYSLQERAIKNNLDIVIDGPKGISKSTVAVWLYLRLREAMKAAGKDLWGPEYTWSVAQCLAAYTNCKDCTFVIMDEDHHLTGKGSRISETHWGSLLKSIRLRQVSTVICSPEQEAMPGCETKLTPLAMKREGYDLMKQAERARLEGRPNADELFRKAAAECWCKVLVSARDHSSTGSVAYKPVGHLVINVGDAILFMDANGYEARKKSDLTAITIAQGSMKNYTEKDWIEAHEIEELLVAAAHARVPPWDGEAKSFLESVAFDAKINLPPKTAKFILDFVWARRKEFHKGPESPKREVNPGEFVAVSEFKPDYDKILNEIAVEKEGLWDKAIQIYRRHVLEHALQDDLAKEFHFKNASPISKNVSKMKGAVVEKRGHQYEAYVQQKKLETGRFVQVERDGGENKPDLWAFTKDGDAYVWSCKCYEFTRNSYSLNIPAEMGPEIDLARELVKTHAHVFLYLQKLNLADNLEEEIPVNFETPPQTYILSYVGPE